MIPDLRFIPHNEINHKSEIINENLLNHNFNFVLVVHVRHSQTSLPLLSLNHNFLTTNNVYTLGGIEHAATLQIVNLG